MGGKFLIKIKIEKFRGGLWYFLLKFLLNRRVITPQNISDQNRNQKLTFGIMLEFCGGRFFAPILFILENLPVCAFGKQRSRVTSNLTESFMTNTTLK